MTLAVLIDSEDLAFLTPSLLPGDADVLIVWGLGNLFGLLSVYLDRTRFGRMTFVVGRTVDSCWEVSEPMNTIRTFVAVDVAEAVRQRAARLTGILAVGGADVKWVEPQNMHLTLQFLGDVPQGDVPAVCQVVERAVEGIPPFSMTVMGAGAFPHPGRPNTIWIGVGEGSEELVALQRAVQRALKPLGFPPERRAFHPHLTVGRMRRGGGPARQGLTQALHEQLAFDAGSSMVEQVTVYASYLDRTGPTYQAISRIGLTGPSREAQYLADNPASSM